MLKFKRNYYAEFVIYENFEKKQVITVSYPTTLKLQVNIDVLNNTNSASFQFINLSPEVQKALWIDIFTNVDVKNIEMNLYAGYDETMPLIFSGIIKTCMSYRQSGTVDWVTDIQAFAGGRFSEYGFINTTFSEGTEFKDIVNTMLEQYPNLSVGCISPDIPPLKRDTSFIGQSLDLLGKNYGDYSIFINQGQLHVLGNNDVIEGELLVISKETGLLGIPRKSGVFVECDMVFEPQLKINQAISLMVDNQLMQDLGFNQAYVVNSIKHYGIISEMTCGTLRTTATLSALHSEPRKVEKAKPTTYNSQTNTKTWDKPIKIGVGKISSAFGSRTAPLAHSSTYHEGIDIAAPFNTPIYAPANGKVIFANFDNTRTANGKTVRIDHGIIDGKHVESVYIHLNSIKTAQYKDVFKGDVIGYVGTSGYYKDGKPSSTGPHLHFGVKENNTPVNPIKYIGSY